MSFERSLKRTKSTQYRMEIDPQAYKLFMDAIANGMSIESASHVAGLRPKTVQSWLEKGDILEGEDLPVGCSAWQYARFSSDYKKSRALFEAKHVANINTKATSESPGQWTASAWMLERRRPKDYGQQYQIEKTGDAKVLEFIKFMFESSPTDLFREQLASIVALIPALRLSEVDHET